MYLFLNQIETLLSGFNQIMSATSLLANYHDLYFYPIDWTKVTNLTITLCEPIASYN